MVQISPELRAAIDTAKERVEVDTYFPKAMNDGLKGNAQGFWSGTVLGFFTGGVAGGLISLAMNMVAPGSGLIGWPLILGVAGIGGTAGGVTGARIGAGSGAIAGVAAERERRDKAEKLEQEILASPERQRAAIEDYRANPVVEKNTTAEEIFATSRDSGSAWGKIIDPRTFVAAIVICTLVSVALFGGAFLLAGGPLVGSVAGVGGNGIMTGLGALGVHSLGAAAAVGAAAGAATGVSFGIAYPPIFAGLTKKVADFLSGKTMHGKTQFAPAKTVAEMEQEAVRNRAVSGVTSPVRPPVPTRYSAEMPDFTVHDIASAERLQPLMQQART